MTIEARLRMHSIDDEDEPDYSRILDNIAASQDIDKLMVFVANAQKKNVPLIRDAALARIKALMPDYKKGSFENVFWEMFTAYQTVLLDNGKPTVKLNQALKSALEESESEVLSDWVNSKAQAWAFEHLITQGKRELTAEGLVLRFPKKFTPDLRNLAKQRLKSIDDKILKSS